MLRDNLPAIPDTADLETDVIDGEVVETPAQRPVIVLRPAVAAVHVVLVVVRHEHTRRAVLHVSYIPLGAYVVGRRLWESRTTTRYERMIRAAEAAGDHKAALEWDARRAEFVRARHDRKMQRSASRIATARAVPWIAGSTLIVLFLLGVLLAVAEHRIGAVAEPVEVLARVVELAVIVVSVSWLPVLLAAPWVAVAALWHVGRNAGSTPGWGMAARPGDEDSGIIVTADTIVLGLQNLDRIPALKRAFKDGWRPAFSLLPVRDGEGYSAVFSLPLGVTAQMIADQRAVFARNLHRAEVETWPTDAEREGTGAAGSVALWVADRGVLDKPAPEYPLLHEGTADVFTGVPGGVTARGDQVLIPVVGNNIVAGGMMGQGKSNACRVIMLGCALDPLCELDVFVFAQNGDFDAYAPRLARYHKGLDDDTLQAAVDRLYELYEEVGRREARLAELNAKKLTRGLAEAHPDMRPIVALFSECHELFSHPEFGPVAAELAVKTAKRARKTGVVLAFDTQSSRKDAIPPALVELVSVNVCFAVKSWRSNDGFLGDGSFQAGIRATELRPKRDRGRSLITGVSDAQFELLKWYFIAVDDDTGFDAAADVITRAVKNLAPGTPVAGSDGASLPVITVRDLLDDLDAVIDGPWRVSVNELPHRLKRLDRTWPEYRSLTGRELRARLTDLGVKTTNTDNKPELDPAELQRVIAERERMSELP